MTIKTFHPDHTPSKHEFYIQSRGLHSGRPLRNPIPNCFVMICNSQKQRDENFNMVQSLFSAKAFSQHITGSVIPMIRISDMRRVIQFGLSIRDKNPSGFENTHKLVTDIDTLLENTEKKLDLLKQLKRAQLHQFFSES